MAVLYSLIQVLMVSDVRFPHDFFIYWKKETQLHTNYTKGQRSNIEIITPRCAHGIYLKLKLWTRQFSAGVCGLVLCCFVPFSTWILKAAFFLLP